MASYQIPPPSPMSLQGDVVENWKEFEASWDDYIIATQLDLKLKKADGTPDPSGIKMVSATLCAIMGPACKRILMNLPTLTEEKRKFPEEIITALRNYFIPQRNVLYERFIFNSTSQQPGETIDQFVMRLRQLSESCEFSTLQDQLIRDRIVIGTTDEAGRKRLLRERPVPDLNRTVDSLRAAEMSRSHKEVMSGKASSVDHMKDHSGRNRTQRSSHQANAQHYQSQSNRRSYSNLPKKFRCNWCGTANQPHARRDCPARDSTCNNCKKKGHWSVVCKSMSAHRNPRK